MGIYVILAVMVVGYFVLKAKLPALRGCTGEYVVAGILNRLPPEEYFVVNDVYLPITGGTTQIDHVVVSRFGIFVIETKNYSGWIFGSADAKMWTQTIYRQRHTFQNPIRQNYRHICALAENLGLPRDVFCGVVVFLGEAEFKSGMPEGVIYASDLLKYISCFGDAVFDNAQVHDILSALIRRAAAVTPRQRRSHVANLHRRVRCGG